MGFTLEYYQRANFMNLHIHGRVLPEDKEKDIYIVDGHITFQKVKDAKNVYKANGIYFFCDCYSSSFETYF